MANLQNLRGIQSLSSVISSLERRFVKRIEDEEEEEGTTTAAAAAGGEEQDEEQLAGRKKKKQRLSSKKIKPTKEEREWIEAGEGFIDDTELIEEEEQEELEEEEAAIKPEISVAESSSATPTTSLASRFVAVKVERSATDTRKSNKNKIGSSESRARFLAEYRDDWIPPPSVQQQLFALREALKKGFQTPKDWNSRRRKGLGHIDTLLLQVDRAAIKELHGVRTPGYIACLVDAFPEPFTRGKVIAHLERVLLRRSWRRKERRLQDRQKEAVEAITRRLRSDMGISPPPPPNKSTNNALSKFNLSALEKSFDLYDPDGIQCLETLVAELTQDLPSLDSLKRLGLKINTWAVAAFQSLPPGQPPSNAFVAARDLLEQMQRTDAYFSWDGPSRASMWRLGEACKVCARARAKLEAWVVERRADLILGGGEGTPFNFRPKPKDLEAYYLEAEESVYSQAFKQIVPNATIAELQKIGKSANLMRALREPPAEYYFVDEQGDFVPYTGPPPPPPKPQAQTPQPMEIEGAAGAPPVAAAGGAAPLSAATTIVPSVVGGTVSAALASSIPSSTVQTTASQAAGSSAMPAQSPAAVAGDKDHFVPSKGKRFQKIEWRMDDFIVGGYVPRDAPEDKESKAIGGKDEKNQKASSSDKGNKKPGEKSGKKTSEEASGAVETTTATISPTPPATMSPSNPEEAMSATESSQ